MRRLVYCMGKSPIIKTMSFEMKFSYLKCVANLSLVPILKTSWRRLLKLFETVTPPFFWWFSHLIPYSPDTQAVAHTTYFELAEPVPEKELARKPGILKLRNSGWDRLGLVGIGLPRPTGTQCRKVHIDALRRGQTIPYTSQTSETYIWLGRNEESIFRWQNNWQLSFIEVIEDYGGQANKSMREKC